MFSLASGADWPGNQTKSLPFYNVASANSQNLTSTEIPKIKKRPNGLVARFILSLCHNRPPFHLVEMSSLHSAWIPASKNASSHFPWEKMSSSNQHKVRKVTCLLLHFPPSSWTRQSTTIVKQLQSP